MTFTNRHNLPAPIVRVLQFDDYDGHTVDCYSTVTGLLKPPWMRFLEKRHAHELEVDVSTRLWSVFGSAVHDRLERANAGGGQTLTEERLTGDIAGRRISGKFDLYWQDDNGLWTISDLKTTSAWKIVHEPDNFDWAFQLNCYAYLARQIGMRVDRLTVWAIIRDWQRSKALADADYPQADFVEVDIPLRPDGHTECLARGLYNAHDFAADPSNPMGDSHDCTPTERWETPTQWAVMRGDQKRALKVFDNERYATQLADLTPQGWVQKRPGERKRCANYCAVSKFCPSWQKYQAAQGGEA